jgi:hypothetical protein
MLWCKLHDTLPLVLDRHGAWVALHWCSNFYLNGLSMPRGHVPTGLEWESLQLCMVFRHEANNASKYSYLSFVLWSFLGNNITLQQVKQCLHPCSNDKATSTSWLIQPWLAIQVSRPSISSSSNFPQSSVLLPAFLTRSFRGHHCC